LEFALTGIIATGPCDLWHDDDVQLGRTRAAKLRTIGIWISGLLASAIIGGFIRPMSALPSKADIADAMKNVRFVP
jgi:hypothetical protein